MEKIVYQVYRTLIFSISFDLISDQLHSRYHERSEDPGDLEKEWLGQDSNFDRSNCPEDCYFFNFDK